MSRRALVPVVVLATCGAVGLGAWVLGAREAGLIRGTTAPGALVTAFPAWAPGSSGAADEESCPCASECGRASARCGCEEARRRARESREARRRASQALSSTTARRDGAFVLSELGDGPVDLWAEGTQGMGWRPRVQPGDRGAALRLEPGVLLDVKVVAPDGAPVAGAPVLAVAEEFGRAFEARTDAEGRATLGPLPRVGYRVEGEAAGLRGSIDVAADLAGEVTVRLLPAAAVEGQVVDGAGPVSGAHVRLEAPRCHQEVATDAQGRFSFSDFGPGGGLLLVASANDRLAAEGLWSPHGERRTDVRLDLSFGAAALAGTVRDAAGRPVPGAKVACVLRASEVSGVPGLPLAERTATAGEDGAWAASPVAPGACSLRASAPGFADTEVLLRPVTAGETRTVDLVLQPQALLAGRALDAAGRPVAGVEISVRQEEASGAEQGGADEPLDGSTELLERRRAKARTGPDGVFRIEGLPAGSYLLAAEKDGLRPLAQAVAAPDEAIEIRLSEVRPEDLSSWRSATVRGHVLDEQGRPQAALVFAVRDGGGHASVRVGPDGAFALRGLQGGTWRVSALVTAETGLGQRCSAIARVVEGGEAAVDLRPGTGGATLVVRLRGAGADDACAALLMPALEDGAAPPLGPPASARALDGAARFAGIEPGRYTVLATCGGGAEGALARESVLVAGEGEQLLELDLPTSPLDR